MPGGSAYVLGGAVQFGTASIFVHAAYHAVRNWNDHVGAVAAYRLVPARWNVAAAGFVAVLNMVPALLLVPAQTLAACAGCFLLLLYAAAILINLHRGRTDIACGCGGSGQKISNRLVARNMAMALLLALAAFLPFPQRDDPIIAAIIVAGGISYAALYFAASQLLANHAVLAEAHA